MCPDSCLPTFVKWDVLKRRNLAWGFSQVSLEISRGNIFFGPKCCLTLSLRARDGKFEQHLMQRSCHLLGSVVRRGTVRHLPSLQAGWWDSAVALGCPSAPSAGGVLGTPERYGLSREVCLKTHTESVCQEITAFQGVTLLSC